MPDLYNCSNFNTEIYKLYYKFQKGRLPNSTELSEFQENLVKKKKRDKYHMIAIIILILNYLIPVIVASTLIRMICTGDCYDVLVAIANVVLLIMITLYNFHFQRKYNVLRDFTILINLISGLCVTGDNKIKKEEMIAFMNIYNNIIGNNQITTSIRSNND